MKKWLKILLSLNSLIKALGFQNFFLANKYNHHIEIVEEVNFKKALVIAPHPDDDCFGCGGVMKKISVNGRVTVAYLCDGAGGVSDLNQKIDVSLIEKRKTEAKAAGQILGAEEQIFFGYRDGKLAGAGAAVKAVADLIKRIEPDIILLPSFLDNHPDHRAANDILVKALSGPKISAEIWLYEIWSPILVNRIVIINQEIAAKKQAIEEFKSQLDARGYDKAILGLNQYRAEINAQQGFAEGFFATTPEIYKQLYKKS